MLDQSSSDLLFLRLQRALVGRYSLERELGSGGMGVVFLARDVRLDRPVALKLLRPEIAEQPTFRDRFLNEARIAARLSHPHIVPIHAVEEADGLVFFVMGYIDGETLGEQIRRRGPLSSDENSRMMREVAWALAYAHASGVIHRDIKADNILLERNSGRALLADFGIAQAASSTDSAQLVGTTTYLAPEVIEGSPATARSDLYALGVVGFFTAAGRLPFDGISNAEIMARHLAQPIPRISDAAPGVSARLARAIDRCLAKDPAARFASAEEFAAALEHHASLVPIQPVAIQQWLRRWDRIAPAYAVAMPVVGMLVMQYGLYELYANYYYWAHVYNWPEFALLLALGVHGVFSILQLRRVLAAGYTREDLVVALGQQRLPATADGEMRPLAPLPARVIRDLTYVAFGIFALAALAVHFIIPRVWDLEQARYIYYTLVNYLVVARLAVYVGLGVGVVYPGRYRRTGNWWDRLQLRFWSSRLGTVAARVVGVGLHPQLAAQTVHRPTEIALSLAADQLFAALPATLQSDLGDVPALVKTLEHQATTLRVSIDDLETAGIGTGQGSTPDQVALVDLRRTLEQRQAEVITALERIRLQLIRLAAGANDLPEITEVLHAARRLDQELGRSIAGQASVRRLLDRKRSPTGLTPRPSPV